MYRAKLCLGLNKQFGLPYEEQIALWQETGFDGFFAYWQPGLDVGALRRAGETRGLAFQSIHSNHLLMADMWEETPRTQQAMEELLQCLRDCADNGVNIMVTHAIIGFDKHTPTDMGLKNFEKIVKEAERLQVRVAFENTEGEEYLAALMQRFAGHPLVGFCWDSGHEMCYNDRDMLALYGDRLFCTHLNDNLGIKDAGGKTDWRDDLHLLPFDGAGDWAEMMHRLNRWGYDDFLTFEIKLASLPTRRENDLYRHLTIQEYITLAYARACRAAMMKIRDALQAEKSVL